MVLLRMTRAVLLSRRTARMSSSVWSKDSGSSQRGVARSGIHFVIPSPSSLALLEGRLREGFAFPPLEDLLAAGENVVERVLKMNGRLSELAADLIDIFLVALLDLFSEQLA